MVTPLRTRRKRSLRGRQQNQNHLAASSASHISSSSQTASTSSLLSTSRSAARQVLAPATTVSDLDHTPRYAADSKEEEIFAEIVVRTTDDSEMNDMDESSSVASTLSPPPPDLEELNTALEALQALEELEELEELKTKYEEWKMSHVAGYVVFFIPVSGFSGLHTCPTHSESCCGTKWLRLTLDPDSTTTMLLVISTRFLLTSLHPLIPRLSKHNPVRRPL